MNGDVTDDALHNYDVQAYTVELTAGSGPAVGGTDGTHPSYTPDGFAFQDSEADVQTVFEENLPFALDLARSTPDPDDPVSHIGNTAPDFVPNAFPTSYGDPQTVEVNAKRELGTVWAEWLVVETGRRGAVRTSEWDGGIRYGEPGVYYHKLRADIRTGARAGQTVRVRFTARNARSQAFTYTAAQRDHADVLIMAAEDYKGPSSVAGNPPTPYAGPKYLGSYEAALDAAGIGYDVYDTDVTRTAPHPLGVLSHYKAVIWYTADDFLTASPGPAGRHGRGEAARRRGARHARLHERRRQPARHRAERTRRAPGTSSCSIRWRRRRRTRTASPTRRRVRTTPTTRPGRRRTASRSPTTSCSTGWGRTCRSHSIRRPACRRSSRSGTPRSRSIRRVTSGACTRS